MPRHPLAKLLPTPADLLDAELDAQGKANQIIQEIAAWADTPADAEEVLAILAEMQVDFAPLLASAEQERQALEPVWRQQRARRSQAQQARYLNRKTHCCGCYREFRRAEMRPGSLCQPWGLPDGWYCASCYDQGQADWDHQRTRVCANCGKEFLANNFTILLCNHCDSQPLRKEYARLSANLSRARRAGNPATLTLREWLANIHHFNGKCAYCRTRPFEEMEHFLPVELGGGTTADNCVPACGECNRRKGLYHPHSLLPPPGGLDIEGVRAYLLTIGGDDLFSPPGSFPLAADQDGG